jgi:hypothetical protein
VFKVAMYATEASAQSLLQQERQEQERQQQEQQQL